MNYRGESVLAQCLASLEAVIESGDTIVVVDNGHEDTLMRDIRTRFPRIEILTAEYNHGFAAGMNLGIRHLRANGNFDAIWLFNNDAVALPGALKQLKGALELNGSHAIYSPIIYPGPESDPWFAGGRLDFFRMRAEHDHHLSSREIPYETEFLTGCALFIPWTVLLSAGLLDERYFLYYEDAEYSLRIRRLGMKCWVVPMAHVYHGELSQQNPNKTYWLVRSGAEFFLRESRGWRALWVKFYFFLRKLKNRVEIRYTPRALAREVERAYTDVSV